MIRRIQVLNYRCLRFIDLDLDRFHVLVGPNASGKSTLLDVIAFLSDMIRDGLEAAIERRTWDFQDLVWDRPDSRGGFELAVEIAVPDDIADDLPARRDYRVFRYEIAIGESDGGEWRITSERGQLMPTSFRRAPPAPHRTLFPEPPPPPWTILAGGGHRGCRTVLKKSTEGTDSFSSETAPGAGRGWVRRIASGPRRSAFGNLPESPHLPTASYVKSLLGDGTQLSWDLLSSDGRNLHRLIGSLKDSEPELYREWLDHVRIFLEDLERIDTVDQDHDRSLYSRMVYSTGLEVPSWMVSGGTLRFLAVTLIPYLPEQQQVYLLESPENGVHPLALDAVYDSLSSAYESQVLVATYSPGFLSRASPREILCFAKGDEGATDIVRGEDHPLIKGWSGDIDNTLLFANL